jgi:hypothetical protein
MREPQVVRAEDVLVRDGHARERASLTGGQCAVGGGGFRQRFVACHRHKCVEFRLARCRAVEVELGQLDARELLLLEARSELRDRLVMNAHSITFGTR